MKSEFYMSIGEFASLRNVDLNSLRYYEKISVLKPAYCDPSSGYRYYTPDQLALLDVIFFAKSLGMPLNRFLNYTLSASVFKLHTVHLFLDDTPFAF